VEHLPVGIILFAEHDQNSIQRIPSGGCREARRLWMMAMLLRRFDCRAPAICTETDVSYHQSSLVNFGRFRDGHADLFPSPFVKFR
jgi:hypothetical protein